MDAATLQRTAALRRADALAMIYHAKGGHTGGSLPAWIFSPACFTMSCALIPKTRTTPNATALSSARGTAWKGIWRFWPTLTS